MNGYISALRHGVRHPARKSTVIIPTARSGTHGERILDAGRYILEIKTAYGMPLWLTRLLDEHRIFPGKFSKYATAFNMELDKRLNS